MEVNPLSIVDLKGFEASRSGRMLQAIRRSMDLTKAIMRARERNEDILALAYQDRTEIGGNQEEDKALREYALNLPFRVMRWYQAQSTSKRPVVKVSRDAGSSQRPGGPPDALTGMWTGITLERVLWEAGFRREVDALIAEIVPRGTSVLQVGYHKEVVTAEEVRESGKDAQSVIPEALTGDVEAKEGQAHAEIADQLQQVAASPEVQFKVGRRGTEALLSREASHRDAALASDLDETRHVSTRPIRHRIWLKKRRVGEDVGWAPWVYDTEDTEFWWSRETMTRGEALDSDLFSDDFKMKVQGYDGRNISGLAEGGQLPSTDSMDSDSRTAQSEDILDDDEKIVEFFVLWFRRPWMQSGGIRKIVSAETPDIFIERDESNPHVDEMTGEGLIPGFYPFVDFTPIQPSQPVPARTHGVAPMSVGQTQFEQIREINRLLGAYTLRHSARFYQLHPDLKNNKTIQNDLRNGVDGASFFATGSMVGQDGKMIPGILPIQFSGDTKMLIGRKMELIGDYLHVMGMPPAVYQGMGTAETAQQDKIGVAAGERESGSMITYIEMRMAMVLQKIRGLIRGCYDTEDYVGLLGVEGAQVMTAWAKKTVDYGDFIEITFGARAQAERTVRTKQFMEAIALERGEVEPLSQIPKYDHTHLFEELHRLIDVGPPIPNESVEKALQMRIMELEATVKKLLMAVDAQKAAIQSNGKDGKKSTSSKGGPRPSEGGGPSSENIEAGARRGTESSDQQSDITNARSVAGTVPVA